MLSKEKQTTRKKHAFTLAEVLITLGIIGVVAAITIPILYNNYLKNQTVTRLQKAYSVIYEAIRLSENDNGPTNTWSYPTIDSDYASELLWFNTYLKPYMKYTRISEQDYGGIYPRVLVSLLDGTEISFWYEYTLMHVFVFTDGCNWDAASNKCQRKEIGGKNYFTFIIKSTALTNAFCPYDSHTMCSDQVGKREYWTCDNSYGCTSTASNADKPLCAGLIMYDGWQIKSDYPYFN